MKQRGGINMANNRLYIKCKKCNEGFMLCKIYPITSGYVSDRINTLPEFIAKHSYLCFDDANMTSDFTKYFEFGDDGIEVTREWDKEKEKIWRKIANKYDKAWEERMRGKK